MPDSTIKCKHHKLYVGEYLFLNESDSTFIIGLIKCPNTYSKSFFKTDSSYTFTADTSNAINITIRKYHFLNMFETMPNTCSIGLINRIQQIPSITSNHFNEDISDFIRPVFGTKLERSEIKLKILKNSN
jgi:hypothetical protein